jgi:nucleoside-diphosphate-sugar epimerase
MAIVNVFGGYGFVGSEYCNFTKEGYIKNYRDNYEVRSANCVYFISTVDNYNVHVDSLLDINTNLVVLMKVLDNYRDYIKRTGEQGVFNFMSSWFVYGQDSGFSGGHPSQIGNGPRGIPETDPCEPKGFYSITKRCAEQLLMSYCETFGLQYRILRLANVLGKQDKKVSAKKNALQYLLGEIAANRPVDLYDSGYFYRDYIDVRDCARAIDLVVQRGEINSIYNIGNGKPIIFRDIVRYARDAMDSASELRTIEQKEFHKKVQSSRSFFMDNTKLESLGYRPQYTIQETVDDIISGILTGKNN